MDREYAASDAVQQSDAAKSNPAPAPMTPRIVGPLDLNPVEFRLGLERRAQNRKLLVDTIHRELTPGVDFGSVPIRGRPSKPSLRKPGAEKICGICGVTARFPSLREYERQSLEGKRSDIVIIRCELTNPDGNVIGEGGGARLLAQDYDDPNKSLKMALKSAQIDATIRTFGLSEHFTQDIEDMSPERVAEEEAADRNAPMAAPAPSAQQPSREPYHARPQQAARTGGGFTRVISEKQEKLLWVKLDQSGVPESDLLNKYNIPKLAALPAGLMNDALAWLQSVHQ